MKHKKNHKSPAQKTASKIRKRYSKGYVKTPTKVQRAKRALFEVSEGLTLHKAAEKFELSYSYLQRRACGTVSVNARKGPSPFLSQEVEDAIVKYICLMVLRCMGLIPADVMDLVQHFLKKDKEQNSF